MEAFAVEERDLKKTLTKIFKKSFGDGAFATDPLEIIDGLEVSLRTRDCTTHESGKRAYSLVPFEVEESDALNFWITTALRFEREKTLMRFSSLSISLFEGLSTDPQKRMLFRAEWDSVANSHAQPHWHLLEAPLSIQSDESFFEADARVVQQFGEEGTSEFSRDDFPVYNLAHFHFALGATWQHRLGGHVAGLESIEELEWWLSGYYSYVRSQLAYCQKHSSSVAIALP